MTFNEANTVEAFIRDRLKGSTSSPTVTPGLARQSGAISGLGWHFVGPADLPRQSQEALVESLSARCPDPPEPRHRRQSAPAWTTCSTACAPSS